MAAIVKKIPIFNKRKHLEIYMPTSDVLKGQQLFQNAIESVSQD